MVSERALVHSALEATWECFYGAEQGTRFERRSDLIVALYPSLPIPQCNGVWIVDDSQAAVDALPGAIAEVEASGVWPWVQTRLGHDRTRQAASDLGLTRTERIPGMVMRADEFVPARAEVEIELIGDDDIDETNEILAACFEAPKQLFDDFCGSLRTMSEVSWYIGRADGAIVSTALGFTLNGATGIFNVATPREHRARGYGAALTSHALRDGFGAGSELAFLQASEIGHNVYHRLGFRDVEEYVLLTRPFPS